MRTISAISSQLDIALTCGLPHPFAFVRKGGQGALHQGATHFRIELEGQPIAAKFCGALLLLTDEGVPLVRGLTPLRCTLLRKSPPKRSLDGPAPWDSHVCSNQS